MFAAQHPVEKLKRIELGPLTLEGLPQGRYRLLEEKEVEGLRRAMSARPAENRKWKVEKGKAPRTAAQREKAKN